MQAVDVTFGGNVIQAAVPESFSERLMGLRRRRGPMLFKASSVHGVGMDRTLLVVAIGRDRRVKSTQHLRPGGFVFVKGAVWMLELEVRSITPAVGTALHFYSPTHDRTTGGVRHSDRKSG